MLTSQVEADTKYIKQVKDALAEKKAEWKDRQSLRLKEQEAISKAISILHSDDARDLFKKSLASQGYLFLQEMSSKQVRGKDAATRLLKKASSVSKDGRLMMIVSRLSAGGHFDEVIEAIDKMVTMLKEEEADDLKQKETCEQDRADDTRSAIKTSRTMDELTEAIMALNDEIEEAKKDKAEKEAEVESIKKELEELTKIRESENKEYLIAKADDEAASELVAQAKGVLETFYKENDLMLSQTAVRQPFTSEAGKAPPPPPTTWDGGYQGKTDESTGIIAVLGMIKEDIDKDVEKATKSEKEAQDLFDETKKEMETSMENLGKLINELTLTISKKKGLVSDNTDSRLKEHGTLVAIMEKIKDAEPGCDYFTINFPLRSRDRNTEIDGLIKAKAILQGAKFDKGPDPSREIKLGDAFVQTQLRR
jgi:peptidoglycan hydrolase CwlO-like protein